MSGMLYSALLLTNLSSFSKTNGCVSGFVKGAFPGSTLFEECQLTVPKIINDSSRASRSFKSNVSSEKYRGDKIATSTQLDNFLISTTTEDFFNNVDETTFYFTEDKNLINKASLISTKKKASNLPKKKRISHVIKSLLKNKYNSLKDDNSNDTNKVIKSNVQESIPLKDSQQAYVNYFRDKASYGISGFPSDYKTFRQYLSPNYFRKNQLPLLNPRQFKCDEIDSDSFSDNIKSNDKHEGHHGAKTVYYQRSKSRGFDYIYPDEHSYNINNDKGGNMYSASELSYDEDITPDDYQYDDAANNMFRRVNHLSDNSRQDMENQSENLSNPNFPQIDFSKFSYNLTPNNIRLMNSDIFPNPEKRPSYETYSEPLTAPKQSQFSSPNFVYQYLNSPGMNYPANTFSSLFNYPSYSKYPTVTYSRPTGAQINTALKELVNYIGTQDQLKSRQFSDNNISNYMDFISKLQTEMRGNGNIKS